MASRGQNEFFRGGNVPLSPGCEHRVSALMLMKYFIVRIYGEEGTDNRQPFGIVERVSDSRKLAFRDSDELWKILNPSSRRGPSGAEEAEQANKAELKRR